MTAPTVTPKQGDRIIIRNIPEDYHYKDLYITEDAYQGVVEAPYTPGRTGFMTGYTPYLDELRSYACSGCGYGIATDKLRFIERAPATFWRFKNGIPKATNGEDYLLEVNIFECEFSDIKK